MSFEDESQVLAPSASLDDDYGDLDGDLGGLAPGPGGGGGRGGGGGGGGGDDDGGEELDFREDFLDLRRVFMNEKMAPELLGFEAELVDAIQGALQAQQDRIDEFEPIGVGERVMVSLLRMEHDRIEFMLKSYLRVRLQKIEQYILHYTHTPEMRQRLSPAELKFAEGYLQLFGELCDTSILQHLSKPFNALRPDDEHLEPNLDSFVFCRARTDLGMVDLRPENERGAGDAAIGVQEIGEGNQIVTRYSAIRPFVLDGSVQLI